jgi:precorrin-2 dehydrogenase / sirohydrochlorin ferrochelatase
MSVFLPISLNISGKLIVIIGGGRIASHKIKFLEPFNPEIKIVASEILSEIKDKGFKYVEKYYESDDLNGAFMIYACTNITELNKTVKKDAESKGILCNVVDNPELCDFVSPAIFKHGIYTVACGSNGEDVHSSIKIRNRIKSLFQQAPDDFINN